MAPLPEPRDAVRLGGLRIGVSRRGAVDPCHYRPNFRETTGPKVYDALDGEAGAVVMDCGTAGTLTGTTRNVLERDPDARVVAVEPEWSVFSARDPEEGEYAVGLFPPATERRSSLGPPGRSLR